MKAVWSPLTCLYFGYCVVCVLRISLCCGRSDRILNTSEVFVNEDLFRVALVSALLMCFPLVLSHMLSPAFSAPAIGCCGWYLVGVT